ncbi:transposase, partial [Salmonella enterica subsp. enterica serovar Reading]|nr:transposase [Salmonella enterica subsp. enterica serovar Reading]
MMFITAGDIVGLPGLPGSIQGARKALRKWASGSESMKRKASDSVAIEYDINCLPESVRDAVLSKVLEKNKPEVAPVTTKHRVTARDEVGIMEQCPAVVEQALHQLTQTQKEIASARILLAAEVHNLR